MLGLPPDQMIWALTPETEVAVSLTTCLLKALAHVWWPRDRLRIQVAPEAGCLPDEIEAAAVALWRAPPKPGAARPGSVVPWPAVAPAELILLASAPGLTPRDPAAVT